MTSTIRVLLVEEYTLARVGMRHVLHTQRNVTVVGEAAEVEAALRLLVALPVGPVDDLHAIRAVLKLGIRGYLPREAAKGALVAALRTVYSGRKAIDANVRTMLEEAPPAGCVAGLTLRQHEVYSLLALGRSNGQIAEELTLSRRTVEGHARLILGKLGRRGRCALIAQAAHDEADAG